jgi:hypothetical protein
MPCGSPTFPADPTLRTQLGFGEVGAFRLASFRSLTCHRPQATCVVLVVAVRRVGPRIAKGPEPPPRSETVARTFRRSLVLLASRSKRVTTSTSPALSDESDGFLSSFI